MASKLCGLDTLFGSTGPRKRVGLQIWSLYSWNGLAPLTRLRTTRCTWTLHLYIHTFFAGSIFTNPIWLQRKTQKLYSMYYVIVVYARLLPQCHCRSGTSAILGRCFIISGWPLGDSVFFHGTQTMYISRVCCCLLVPWWAILYVPSQSKIGRYLKNVLVLALVCGKCQVEHIYWALIHIPLKGTIKFLWL